MEAIIGSPALTVVENDVAVSILNLESAKKPWVAIDLWQASMC